MSYVLSIYILSPRGVVILERNVCGNAHYNIRECIKVKPVPKEISDNALEGTLCETLLLTRSIGGPRV